MKSTIQYIKQELAPFYPEPELEGFVRIIMETVNGLSFTQMVLNRDQVLPSEKLEQVTEVVRRLKNYEPIQYVLGQTEFFGLCLKVSPAVLIPRPETEELVDWVLSEVRPGTLSVLDVGTGSGCIALALKNRLPLARVSAVDISEEALELARQNAAENCLEVDFRREDILKWEASFWSEYDVVVSNPPYVRNSEKAQMEKNVLEYEPETALFVSDEDPLVFYRAIAGFAARYLKPGGHLFFEINEFLGEEMKRLLLELGFVGLQLRTDVNGRPRMIVGRKKL